MTMSQPVTKSPTVIRSTPPAGHSLDALSGTLARALANARAHQVLAARRSELRMAAGGISAPSAGLSAQSSRRNTDRMAARSRRYHLLGTVGGWAAARNRAAVAAGRPAGPANLDRPDLTGQP
jgi:hypothetical protein